MDNIRFGLLCAATVICFFIYQAWQQDYGSTHHARTAAVQQQSQKATDGSDVPGMDGASSGKSGSPAQVPDAGKAGANPGGPSGSRPAPLSSDQEIHIVTDRFDAIIDAHGGGLRQVDLRGVPLSDENPNTNLRLINDSLPGFYIEQSGLISPNSDAPNHNTNYKTASKSYHLAKNKDTLRVPLTWTDGKGHKVTKIYVFHRGSYEIGLKYELENETGKPWDVAQYVRYWRTPYGDTGSVPFSRAFFGVGWYAKNGKDDFSYEKRKSEDLGSSPLVLKQSGGWIAMVAHYFVGAVIPPAHHDVRMFAKSKPVMGNSKGYAAGFVGARRTVPANGKLELGSQLFIGPKHEDQLAATAPGLDLTINYGWYAILARPLFTVLQFFHNYVGNWGVAIILLTVLIKLLFYKLSEIQYRGMARMRKFQPRMARLKEQYGDDRAELQKRMMELYKKEGFNPMAGCWPLVVQMPVFISLYWVLREAAELRQAPFFLWIHDLSAPDPYFILPIIFGVIMLLQQKLNVTAVMDPMQQRIMQIMPIGMAVFFCFFPSGLVLYYCVNSLLSILQQWYIYRKLDAEGLGHNSGKESS